MPLADCGWSWQPFGSSGHSSPWKPQASCEEVQLLSALCPGSAKHREATGPGEGEMLRQGGGLSIGNWLCQLLLLATDQTWERGLLATTLFTLYELWVENSGSLRIISEWLLGPLRII